MVVDRKKKQKTLALLNLASGPLPNAANSSDVPTEFAGGDQLSTKKRIEYSFKLSLSFIDIRYFSQV